ncbi:MAG: hypothetical protein JWM44_2568 [Bacilli bacterium]|nr:hypothetical protein [Bacilli bacterium]
MKKKWFVGLMLIFMLSFSATQVFADEQAQKEQVYVDGDQIAFSVDPTIDNGTTLVQFKPVFEKLGLTVTWNGDTQTVTGTTYNLNIQLTIGSKTVVVNGKEEQLTVAPKIINDVTMIPLRFVGEASGREVSWDGRTKTVFIAKTEEQIYHLIKKNIDYTQVEDLDGFISTIDPNTAQLAQIKLGVQQTFAAFDLNYTLDKMEIIGVKDNQAAVKATITTKKVKGPEFKDNKMDEIINLSKVNGEWKLGLSQVIKTDYMNEDLFKDQKVTLSDEDQKQVLAVIEKNRDASEKEDFDGVLSTYDKDYANLDQLIRAGKQLTAAFDFKITNDQIQFVMGADGTAEVRYFQTVRKVKGPQFPNLKIDGVDTLKKNKDGEWKITKSDVLTQEVIQ